MPARSMTGYGAAARDGAHAKVRVEVRAVNHRFLDVSLNVPSALHAKEAELRALVAERVRRARLDVWISWEPKVDGGYHVKVNRELLAELHRSLEEVRLSLRIPSDVGVDILTRFPEAIRIEQPGSALEPGAFEDLKVALEEALAALDQARVVEGEALVRDIAARVAVISEHVEAAARSSEAEPAKIAERLRERVQQLLGDPKVDPDRLHQEIAFLAERSDVTEELVRLRTHLDRARSLLAAADELGKPFDFLLQELSREVNTLGSKSRSPETTGHVLAMKSEIEKIREQARNLE